MSGAPPTILTPFLTHWNGNGAGIPWNGLQLLYRMYGMCYEERKSNGESESEMEMLLFEMENDSPYLYYSRIRWER